MTTSNRVLELINREIDGLNSPKESEELSEYLARDRDAAFLFEDLKRVSTIVGGAEPVEPPRNLRANILNSIDPKRYAEKRRLNPLTILVNFLPQRASLRYALVFSFGIVLGVVIYGLLSDLGKQGSVESTTLYGTMRLDRASEAFEPADNLEISLQNVQGSVSTKHGRGLVSVELALQSQQEVETVLQFDPHSLSFVGLQQLDYTGNNINIGGNAVQVRNTGDNKYVFFFSEKAQSPKPMDFKILSSGSLLYEKALSTQKKGQEE
jgi:hypothetical protein